MNAEEFLAKTAKDAGARLRWTVMQRLGVCPVSLRGRMLGRRAALRLAAQMVLDSRTGAQTDFGTAINPNFDLERFRELSGGGRA